MPPQIPLRTLGKNGPAVPAMGFGLMSMSSCYGSITSDEDMFTVLDHAYEIGARFWDTADQYGRCEEIVGKWFAKTGKRNDIFLATKFGYLKGHGTDVKGIDSSGDYAKTACAASLKALQTDWIDLYYVHNVNVETPIEDTMRGLRDLQAEGKIKHIGLSMISSDTLRRAVKIAPVAALQAGYSPFSRDVEGPTGSHLLATCRELDIAFVAATPLDRGLLTSNFVRDEAFGDDKDIRNKALPRFIGENQEKNAKAVKQVTALADRKGITVSQLSLAWLLKQGVIPIPGTKRIKYLDENWAALQVELTDDEEKEMRGVVESIEVAGGHTPDAFMFLLFRDTKAEH